MNDHDIELNTRNVKARTVAFLVALALAVAAFAVGITSLSRKSPGYYDVEANTDDETILYAKTVRLRYYFADGKADIRSTLRELQTVYPGALKEFSRMLDAETTFPGVINPAMLNSNPGKEMTVSAELLAVLTDAYEKTCEQQGYNMFAGPLYAVWDTLLYLEEPQSFDPAVNASEQERIRRIAAVVNDLDNFRFEVVDAVKHIVRFDYSDTVRRMLEEEELGDRILDLNLLREAYLLRLIGDRLEQRGFSDGYLSTTDGQVLCLSGELPGDWLPFPPPRRRSVAVRPSAISGRCPFPTRHTATTSWNRNRIRCAATRLSPRRGSIPMCWSRPVCWRIGETLSRPAMQIFASTPARI